MKTGKSRRKNPEQLLLKSFGHGGARVGAGRKKIKAGKRRVAHAKREKVFSKYPMLVTVKLQRGDLRNKRAFKVFRSAIIRAREFGLRVLEFTLQGNHFHLTTEADSNDALTRGMKSINVSLARNLKVLMKDRFHVEILRTPTQVRNALIYVFANASKHFRRAKVFDFYSSLIHFEQTGFLSKVRRDLDWRIPQIRDEVRKIYDEMLCKPQSWLASRGFLKAV